MEDSMKNNYKKVKYSDAYLVKKIIKETGDKVFFKWLGVDSKYNSWIQKNNIL